ncbi:helix-turn-helix domain-containing protein [Paenibacillus soyae]|uniref:Helix-turn-helix domain-containing protein n=1 Tax=Paenibacillus soyae TaxID=2969249 RepID=A0A9X2MU25_9BACL|nr:helix-turn-helix domain-containing protein [Paenibacillus soyae]MCR2806312.1 helix-turn-helix domain-containing protein [Paenibacillus soyae]
MNVVRGFLLRKSLLVRIILSYLFVGLIILAALTLAITSRVSESLKDELTESTDRSLEQSYNTANILLSSTYRHFANAYASPDIQAGFYAHSFDTAMMGRIGGTLTDLANTNPMVHSVYLLNTRQKLAFSSLTTVRSFDEFYDSQILHLLENTQSLRGSIFIPRHTSFVHDTKPFSGNLISVAYMSTRDDQASNGALILNLDQRVLQTMMMNGAGSKSFQSMIVNRQGVVISHSDDALIQTDVSELPAIQSILQAEASQGVVETEAGGTAHRLFYIKSDSLGWIFIGDVNYGSLLGKVNAVRGYILSVTAVILVAVMVSGFFFTRMIYGPIHRLLKHIAKAPDSESASEFETLSKTFRHLERRVQDLQTSMAGYRHAEREETLRQLAAGAWSSEPDMAARLSRLGIRLPAPGFQIGMLRLDHYEELRQAYSPNDLYLLKYGVSNIADELGAPRFQSFGFDGGEDRIVILFLKPEGEDEELRQLMLDIQRNAERFLQLSVTASLGMHVDDIRQIPQSWQSAYNGSRYRLAYGRKCFIPADIETSRESIQGSQSAGMEKQVTDSMKLGDASRTADAFKQYFGLLRHAPYDETMLLLNQLLFTVTRASKAMASGDLSGLSLDIGTLGQQLYRWETLDEIEEWFIGLGETAISLRDRQSSRKNVMIVEKLKRHIHAHYENPNLTVDMLADVAGLSVNYMRKIFKDIVGVSLNQYLTDHRFEKAKELLLTTDLPANRIGEMVGFDNTKYFYISFKKHCGKTPDHFRKSSGERMEEA